MYDYDEYEAATPKERKAIDAEMIAEHESEMKAENAWLVAAENAGEYDPREEAAMDRDEELYYSRCR